MTRQEILETLEQTICKDRQETYGTPEDSFKNIRDYWHLYLTQIQRPLESHDIAIMMLLLKVARIVKSSQHLDNWIDAAGYAICGGELTSDKSEPIVCQGTCEPEPKPQYFSYHYFPIFPYWFENANPLGKWDGEGWYIVGYFVTPVVASKMYPQSFEKLEHAKSFGESILSN